MAREFILTGAPGAGKTVILRALEAQGIDVVEEAATDVIALDQGRGIDESWRRPQFISDIMQLQLLRAARTATGPVRVADRSLVCTLALAEYLGHPVPQALIESIEAMVATGQYERQVLFVELLGFITNTAARRISPARRCASGACSRRRPPKGPKSATTRPSCRPRAGPRRRSTETRRSCCRGSDTVLRAPPGRSSTRWRVVST